MNEIGLSILSAYDKRKATGAKKSKGDEIVADNLTKQIMMNQLASEMTHTLSDGTVVTSTTREAMTASVIGKLIESGSATDLKTVLTILGEVVDKQIEVNTKSKVDEDLEKRALG